MANPIPAPIAPKSSTFTDQVATATSIADLHRAIANPTLRVAKHSPPNADDLVETGFVLDKTTKRIHVQINGTSHYIQLT